MNGQLLFLQVGILLGLELREGCFFNSSHIEQIEIISIIVSKDRLKHHQYSLVWEVSLGDELQDVRAQV